MYRQDLPRELQAVLPPRDRLSHANPSGVEFILGQPIEPGEGPSRANSWKSGLQVVAHRRRKVLLPEQIAHQYEELDAMGDAQSSIGLHLSAVAALPILEQIFRCGNLLLTSQATSRSLEAHQQAEEAHGPVTQHPPS